MLHIDIETGSHCDLRKAGVYRYAEDPTTRILCVAWTEGDGYGNLWIPRPLRGFPRAAIPDLPDRDRVFIQERPPEPLMQAFENPAELLTAHNASFERTLLNSHAALGLPPTPPERWYCTMAQAQTCNLPADLKTLSKITQNQKTDARNIMLKLSRPNKEGQLWEPEDLPADFACLYKYCIQDVYSERSVYSRFPRISSMERKVYILSERINDRGIQVDLPSVGAAQAVWRECQAKLESEITELTGGIQPGQTGKLADWVREQGFDIENLQAPVVAEALKQLKGKPEFRAVRRVLQCRVQHQSKAPMKYVAMQRAVCADGRLRGMFRYHAAGTGRWSSTIVQLQNIYRGDLKQRDVETALRCYPRGLDWVEWAFPELSAAKVLASTVRGMLVAAPEKRILASDFSQIEARVLPWLAGQTGKLDALRNGIKLYEAVAAKMFGVPLDAVTGEQRLLGKIGELACGYQGGEKAILRTAGAYGLEMTAKKAMALVAQWRLSNAEIVHFWNAIEQACQQAIIHPGTVYPVGDKLAAKLIGEFLCIRLPSKRLLRYFRPFLHEGQICYEGIDTYTRRYQVTSTYGGKLAENVTQAAARDVLVEAMLRLEAAGFSLIGTVHDEVLMEGRSEDLEQVLEIMRQNPAWAEDLPLDATGFVDDRFRKD